MDIRIKIIAILMAELFWLLSFACYANPIKVFQDSSITGLRISVSPLNNTSIPLNRMHSWQLSIQDIEGRPVTGRQFIVVGGMPAHGHALPSKPKAIQLKQAGHYQIDGLKFQMPGAWFVSLIDDSLDKKLVLRFEFEVHP